MTQRKISQSKASMKRLEKKAAAFQMSIDWTKKRIETEIANLKKYEDELIITVANS